MGIVTDYDFVHAMMEGCGISRNIAAMGIMSTVPVTVTEDQTLVQSGPNLFQDRSLTRVPVVRNKKLVGILARRHMLFGYMKAWSAWS